MNPGTAHEELDDEYIDINLRSADEVARRYTILAALLRRATLAQGAATASMLPGDDPETVAFDLREWLRAEALWPELTPDEVIFFERPPSQVTASSSLDPLALGESFAALAWTLGFAPAIVPLAMTDIHLLSVDAPEPWESTRAWLATQELRPEAEIVAQRESDELWEWRLATELARREARVGQPNEFDAAIAEVRQEAHAAGSLVSDGARNDLDLWDEVGQLDTEHVAALHSMTEHRLKALNWVCGFGESWDDVPLDI